MKGYMSTVFGSFSLPKNRNLPNDGSVKKRKMSQNVGCNIPANCIYQVSVFCCGKKILNQKHTENTAF
jgi:hypothetical protein